MVIKGNKKNNNTYLMIGSFQICAADSNSKGNSEDTDCTVDRGH